MGSEACVSLVGSVLPYCLGLASKHAEYASSAKENVDNAISSLDSLKAKRKTFENKIEKKAKENKIPSPLAEDWLKNVDNVAAKVGELKERYGQRRCRATEDCSLNFCLVYSVSKEAARLRKNIEDLKTENVDEYFEDPRQDPAKERAIWPRLGATRSMKCHLKEVRSYLNSNTVGIVGIWGLAGVGKTTLLALINNSMLGEGNLGFDHVIWTQTSRDKTVENLQNAVISELGLRDQTDKNDSRDSRIFQYLNGKNFLLLIDDMFEQISLSSLGIPIPGASTSSQKHKVVFTTHSSSVCTRMATTTIKLDLLGTKEACCLFREIVTEEIINSEPQILSLENEVVDLCGGLPLALVAIGQALSDRRIPEEWQHAIYSIKNQQFGGSLSHIKESVFETLKLSYNSLESDQLQQCFLCCCLWPRGHQIPVNDLIECWIGLGLIGMPEGIHAAYNEGHSIIGDLEGKSLLARDLASGNKCIRLHGVLWFLARWIASDCGRDMNKWVLRADSLDSFRNADQWISTKRISLMNSEAVPLEKIPECHNLNVLILKNNANIVQIPSEFFKQIKRLKYLDLSFTKLENIPTDIEFLVELEYLNLSHTCISSLPTELRRLLKLKYLFLRCIKKLQEESINVISELPQLQVLDVSPYVEITSDVLKKIKIKLKALSMAVKNGALLYVLYGDNSESARERDIPLPLWNIRINETKGDDTLLLNKLSEKQQRFLRKLECQGDDTLLLNKLSEKQRFLRKLEFHSCVNLRYLVVLSGGNNLSLASNNLSNFKELKELCIRHLASLVDIIWQDVSPPVYFPVLRILVIEGCPQLKNITWVLKLPCLEKLHVEDCEGMEEVICDADGIIISITASGLPGLKELILKDLPRLRSIYNQSLNLTFLESIEVMGCPKLQRLPLDLKTTENKKFKKIEGESTWLKRLQWDKEDTKSKFEKYYCERKANTA